MFRLLLKIVLLGYGLCFAAGILWAEPVSDLYHVSRTVGSQSSAELKKASASALKEVFVRVTGDQQLVANTGVRQAIAGASSYLKQFSYRREQQGEQTNLLVDMEFEPALVLKVLRSEGLPVWSSDRPSVLVWLAVQDQQGRQLVREDSHAELLQMIRQHSRRRGLAMKLPLMDLEDNIALTADQVWQLNQLAVKEASARYQADAILVGRVSHLTNGRWLGNWQYLVGGQSFGFEGDAALLDQYIADAVVWVAQQQASNYAIVPVKTAAGGVLIQLSNVRNFEDYARAIRYLEGLSAIVHANVVHIEGDELIVRLIAEGQLQQLEKAIALGKRLQPQGLPETSQYPVVLSYRWSSQG